jgi:hypothetical protein
MADKTIFVIEQGEYSDYRVVGVFTTRKNAETVAAWLNRDGQYGGASVAEWPLNPAVTEINKGMRQWTVHMHKHGSVERVDAAEYTYSLEGEMHEWEREEAPAYKGKGIPNLLTATVWATDEKHAVKIVNERRIQMLALGQWKGKL